MGLLGKNFNFGIGGQNIMDPEAVATTKRNPWQSLIPAIAGAGLGAGISAISGGNMGQSALAGLATGGMMGANSLYNTLGRNQEAETAQKLRDEQDKAYGAFAQQVGLNPAMAKSPEALKMGYGAGQDTANANMANTNASQIGWANHPLAQGTIAPSADFLNNEASRQYKMSTYLKENPNSMNEFNYMMGRRDQLPHGYNPSQEQPFSVQGNMAHAPSGLAVNPQMMSMSPAYSQPARNGQLENQYLDRNKNVMDQQLQHEVHSALLDNQIKDMEKQLMAIQQQGEKQNVRGTTIQNDLMQKLTPMQVQQAQLQNQGQNVQNQGMQQDIKLGQSKVDMYNQLMEQNAQKQYQQQAQVIEQTVKDPVIKQGELARAMLNSFGQKLSPQETRQLQIMVQQADMQRFSTK